MDSSTGPMSAHRGGFVYLTVVTWVALGLSAMLFAAMVIQWLEFAHEVTCSPTPPVEGRHHDLMFFAGVAVVLWLPSLVLVILSKRIWTVVALVLACLSAVVPFLSWMYQIFSIGMC
ncbi:hypothetical protein BH09MYX1_BH09MYX1_06650 [soil metagenome]